MWEKALTNEFNTFESVKKIVKINNWCKNLDKKFDLVFIDESQDFDKLMLDMLLNDVTISKLFVGDPLQNIYSSWRGTINAFDLLPENTLNIEFYSTYRIGNPLCRIITNKFDKCHMISKNPNETIQRTEIGNVNEQYIYLFRTWKCLLKKAEITSNIWIYSIDKKIEEIERLFNKIQGGYYDNDDEEDDEDLPKFLKSLTNYELNQLITNIKNNLVQKEQAEVLFFSIHSFKGMESNIIRVFNDIKMDTEEERNIVYVAYSRAKKVLVLDELPVEPNSSNEIMNMLNKFKK
jgi:superfamily I DNA/RNA helicase